MAGIVAKPPNDTHYISAVTRPDHQTVAFLRYKLQYRIRAPKARVSAFSPWPGSQNATDDNIPGVDGFAGAYLLQR